MPFSSIDNLVPVCLELLWARPKPNLAVDLGFGCGKWAALIREYVDGWGSPQYLQHHTYLVGVDAWEPYVQSWHRALYDELVISDILPFMREGEDWDLALCIDVVEHFEKEQGLELLGLLKKHCKLALVATPVDYFPQGAAFGNPHERHLSGWTIEELAEFGRVTRHETQYLLKISRK